MKYQLHSASAVFQSKNIDFGKSLLDKCDVGAKYRTHCKEPDETHDVHACEQCKVGEDKQRKSYEARAYYRKDRD